MLLSTILAAISETAIYKIGEHAAPIALAEMGFKSVFEKIGDGVKNIYKGKHLQENGDLLKVVRLAMLDATLLLKDAVFAEMKKEAAGSNISNREIAKLEKTFNEWIKTEKKIAGEKANKEQIKTRAYDQIELLLSNSKDETAAEFRVALALACKNEFLSELKNALGENFPSLAKDFLLDGWNDKGEKDWFDITCFLFGQLLKQKENELGKSAFQNRLLSEIATSVGMGDIKFDGVLNLLGQSVDNGKYIKKKVDELNKQMNRIEDGVVRVENKVDVVLHKEDRILEKQDETINYLVNQFEKLTVEHKEDRILEKQDETINYLVNQFEKLTVEFKNVQNKENCDELRLQIQMLIKERDLLIEQLSKRD